MARFSGVDFYSEIPALVAGMEVKAERAVNIIAQEISRGAIMRSRVDTGQMRAGWRVQSSGLSATILNSVNHTPFNEFGTRYMSAQPMLTPAVEEARPRFRQVVGQIFR